MGLPLLTGHSQSSFAHAASSCNGARDAMVLLLLLLASLLLFASADVL